MEKRKNLAFKPLEPELDGQPELREAAEESSQPSLCIALRRARMQAGYELQDVAKALRIQHQHLESLEEGRFADLPGNTYAVGFLRSYSEFLDLDPEDMIRRYKKESASGGLYDAPLSFPTPSKEGRAPKLWLILVALVLAGAAYGGWYYFSMRGTDNTDLVSDLSSKLTEATGLDTAEENAAANATENASSDVASLTPGQGSDVEAAPSVAHNSGAKEHDAMLAEALSSPPSVTNVPKPDKTTDGDQPVISRNSLWDEPPAVSAAAPENAAANAEPAAGATEGIEADSIEAKAIATETAAELRVATPDVADTSLVEVNASVSAEGMMGGNNNLQSGSSSGQMYVPQVYGRGNENYRVVITANADSWVQVQGPQNELLLTRILRAGDSYRVPDREGLLMVTGNAGALQISVDGVVVEAIGPIGAVRRDVVLDAEQLKAGVTSE